jgi:hypothetical protein
MTGETRSSGTPPVSDATSNTSKKPMSSRLRIPLWLLKEMADINELRGMLINATDHVLGRPVTMGEWLALQDEADERYRGLAHHCPGATAPSGPRTLSEWV